MGQPAGWSETLLSESFRKKERAESHDYGAALFNMVQTLCSLDFQSSKQKVCSHYSPLFNYSSSGASTGQTPAHVPHPIQDS